MKMPYRSLDPACILETAHRLRRRITERFPDAGLSRVAAELEKIIEESNERIRIIGQPHIPLRLGILIAVCVLTICVLAPFWTLQLRMTITTWTELVQTMEAGINELVLIGASVFFIVSLETRYKRAKILSAIHELRSLAHIIDMHQLTKDPSRVLHNPVSTNSSPKRGLSPFELSRYLDYCSEMLSLIGKVGALYAQNIQDSVALGAVDEIEELTTSLSRKIWQKIMIIDSRADGSRQ